MCTVGPLFDMVPRTIPVAPHVKAQNRGREEPPSVSLKNTNVALTESLPPTTQFRTDDIFDSRGGSLWALCACFGPIKHGLPVISE